MSFRELEQYIVELRERGFDVVDLVVALHRKASFPFVTVILTLIAVPFAVTRGARALSTAWASVSRSRSPTGSC